MTTSTILGINEVGENQTDKYITINDAISALECAANDRHENSVASAAAVTISATEAVRHAVFYMAAKTGAFDLVFPSTLFGNNAKRLYVVWNASAHACTVKASTGAGTTVVVAAGGKALIAHNFEDMAAISSYVGSAPYDVGFYANGLPGDAATVMKFTAARAFTLADNFAGSVGHVTVNPSLSAAFDVKKNGGSIGTITVSTLGVVSFSTVGATPETFAIGDRIEVTAPTPQDATLADVSISFAGTRAF